MPAANAPKSARRKCTICGEFFQYQQISGRPPAFCPTCIPTDRNRLCIWDDKQFSLDDPACRKPYFCSERCQKAYRYAKKCAYCREAPATREQPFCSTECWAAYMTESPTKQCKRAGCTNPGLAHPLKFQQNYCSEECRIQDYEEVTGEVSERRNMRGNRQLLITLSRMHPPITMLPRMPGNRPWQCPAPTTRTPLEFSPYITQSIEFHRTYMWPQMLKNPPSGLLMFIIYGGYAPRLSSMAPMWDTLPWCWDLLTDEWHTSIQMCLSVYNVPKSIHNDKAIRKWQDLVRGAQDLETKSLTGSGAPQSYMQERLPKMNKWLREFEALTDYPIDTMCPGSSPILFDGVFDLKNVDHQGASKLRSLRDVRWPQWCKKHGIQPEVESPLLLLPREQLVRKWSNSRIPSRSSGPKNA